MEMSFTPAPAEVLTPQDELPDDDTGHYCEECGNPVYRPSGRGRWPRYCDEHKRTNSSGNRSSDSSNNNSKRSNKKRAAKESDWQKFLSIVILGGTYAVGRFAAGGQGITLAPPEGVSQDELEELALYLSMSPEEVGPIAAYLAPLAVPTALNKRYGHLIVNAVELEEIGAALWQYGKRIAPALQQRMQSPAAVATQQERRRQYNLFRKAQENGTAGPHTQGNGQGGPPSVRDIVAATNAARRATAPPDVADN